MKDIINKLEIGDYVKCNSRGGIFKGIVECLGISCLENSICIKRDDNRTGGGCNKGWKLFKNSTNWKSIKILGKSNPNSNIIIKK